MPVSSDSATSALNATAHVGEHARVAIVTGGDFGIGAACATTLARVGCDVVILYHSDDNSAQRVSDEIQGLGRQAFAIKADVAREQDVEAAFQTAKTRLGAPEILVNSAGLNMSGVAVADMTLEQWDKLIATDLTGSFLASRCFIRQYREAGYRQGSIINITSIHAFAMRAGGADYAAAKGGQANLGTTLALELAPMGITVNSIAPGMILTDMNSQAQEDAEHRKKLERNIPLGRAGEADEVGSLAAFLASADARYMTGAHIPLDGGLSLLRVRAHERRDAEFHRQADRRRLSSGPDALDRCDLMSPYVWRADDGRHQILVRAVPRSGENTGRIWFGEGHDGLSFAMDDDALISPGPGPLDIGGCEDPTVVEAHPKYVVYYTGLNENGDGEMLWASGPSIRELTKQGVALESTKTQRNTKEAEVAFLNDNWVLIYEYSQDEASKIGHADGNGPAGPWREVEHPFSARPGRWDGWHLSPGPMLLDDMDYPVMFYNGATRDAEWGIGWVVFDRRANAIAARCDEPLIAANWDGGTGRIAFSASLIKDGPTIHLYFSRDDATLHRAIIDIV